MRLREAAPVRHERSPAFVTRARGCRIEEVRSPVYDVDPQAKELRETRIRAAISLRDAASRAGLRAVEWSGIEHGRMVPESPDDWATLRRAVQP